MTLLIDTNVYLWFENEDSRLSQRVLNEIENPSNQILISIVSIWEISILLRLGKVELKTTLQEAVTLIESNYHFKILPVSAAHCIALESLPYFPSHKNPFDRMIVSQAISEKLKLAANDQYFPNYPADLFW